MTTRYENYRTHQSFLDAPHDAPIDARAIDAAIDAPVMLTAATTFASGLGTLCGIAYDHVDTQVWVYPCDSASVTRFSPAGAVLGTLARPGEVANDVDIDVAPVALTLGVTALAAGDLIVVNGETGVAELYAPETTATAAVVTTFGASHVVGAYRRARARFSTLPAFDVNYGDLDVCQATGHLFVVSRRQRYLSG